MEFTDIFCDLNILKIEFFQRTRFVALVRGKLHICNFLESILSKVTFVFRPIYHAILSSKEFHLDRNQYILTNVSLLCH